MFDRLNLTTQESTAFVLEEDDEDYPGCPIWAIVGKVLAPNILHISTIKVALRPAWGNPKGMEFHSLGTNRFLAEFRCKADKDRVKEGSPWTISKHCILLMDFDPSLKPGDVCFDSLSMWVRILNLPFNLMNDDRGKALASKLGKVEKMDTDNKGRAWGDYLRARISVDVNQPLMRCVSVFSQKRRVTDVYQRERTFELVCINLRGYSQKNLGRACDGRFLAAAPSSEASPAAAIGAHLIGNNISGAFPLLLQKCTPLIFLDLNNNQFSGTLPLWTGEKLLIWKSRRHECWRRLESYRVGRAANHRGLLCEKRPAYGVDEQ
ncbi:hypothetical protein D1007_49038 [Hordeum vulgare]|nr:hypothetical protein D1007_49038 [Hordeum vulgare]